MSLNLGDIGDIFINQSLPIKLYLRNNDKIVIDASTVTTKQIILKRVGGPRKVFTAQFITDGTDGGLTYTTASGDLDVAGTWKAQAVIVENGKEYPSTIITFTVSPRI